MTYLVQMPFNKIGDIILEIIRNTSVPFNL